MEHKTKLDIIKENTLLKLKSGSHLYGLSTPESDEDYLGVVYEPLEYKVGFKTFNEIDMSVVDKLDNGRNSKDAIDEKYYSLTKFVSLLFSNNPTILELIFATDVITTSPLIEELYKNRHSFLTKDKVESAFIGYAIAQEKKMEIKGDNLKEVTKFYEKIKDIVVDGTSTVLDVLSREEHLTDDLLKYKEKQIELSSELKTANDKQQIRALNKKIGKLHLGTRIFSVNILFKKFVAQLEEILSKKSHRSELVEKYNLDVKFFHHTIRLLIEGIELLTTGKITFPLKEKDFLLDCKLGKYTYDEAIELVNVYKEKFRNVSESEKVLTNSQDSSKIEKLILDFYKEKYNFGGN